MTAKRLWNKELNVAGDAMARGVADTRGLFVFCRDLISKKNLGSSKVTAGKFR
jgi:hypothetical protein